MVAGWSIGGEAGPCRRRSLGMLNAVANLLNGIIGGGSKDLSSWD